MKIATLLHSDRHSDPEIAVFATVEGAIAAAKARAKQCDRFGDLDETLTSSMQRAGWLYFARYGEGNSIRVELRDIDGMLDPIRDDGEGDLPVADYEIVDADTPLSLTPEQKARATIVALENAAARVAHALNTIAALEDARALIKPEAIKRLIEAGAASSATAAEKIVERDGDYANHRLKQRDAECEKWGALAAYEAAKLSAALDVALASTAMRNCE